VHAGRFAGPTCWRCGAKRIDKQIGLEETPDAYVAKLVEVFREVRRVLRDDGTLWLNIGDSFTSGDRGWRAPDKKNPARAMTYRPPTPQGLKPKDLIGAPWRVAFALRDDGWYLRSDIIWQKPNPMPESVKDRSTRAHEYIFLLAKSQRYFYNAVAIMEDAVSDHPSGNAYRRPASLSKRDANGPRGSDTPWTDLGGKRNRRDVWTITSEPCPEAHFAIFPRKLVELCVLAGTAESCCAACGMPYQQETARRKVPDRPNRVQNRVGDSLEEAHGADGRTGLRYNIEVVEGPWAPACTCGVAVASCSVLDPFAGSGTVALVARQHGRAWMCFDLNPEYEKIAERRMIKLFGDA
jgi:DNA modification methylase